MKRLKRIYRELLINKGYFLLQILLILMSSLLSVYPIVIIEKVTDLALQGKPANIKTILWWGVVYLGVQALQSGITAVSTYYAYSMQAEITYNLQVNIFDHITKVKLKEIRFSDVAQINSTLIEDTKFIGENIVEPFSDFVSSIFAFCLGFYYITRINFYLGCLIFPLGLISAFTSRELSKRSYKNIEMCRKETSSLWKTFNEGIMGFLSLRFHDSVSEYQQKIVGQGRSLKKASLTQSKLESVTYFFTNTLFMVTIGSIMTVSAIFVVEKKITIGGLTAIMMYNSLLSQPLIQLQDVVKRIQRLKVSAGRIFQVMDLPAGNKEEYGAVDEIQVRNLCYTVEGKQILQNINLDIKVGDSLMIQGTTGAGKTTLVNVITGLYDSTQGSVKYLHKNRPAMRLPRVSYMLQDEYLFDDTIYHNILVGNQRADEAKLREVIAICGLEEIVRSHKGNIGNNGIHLSGGERKRVLLARTIIDSEADVFVFDEMSASLDHATFLEVWERIDTYLKKKIRIYIEHDTCIKDRVKNVLTVQFEKG